MNTIFMSIAALWTLRILLNIFSYAQLWYVKEYRFDRMFIHFHTRGWGSILAPAWRFPPVSPKSVVVTIGSSIGLLAIFFFVPLPVLARLLLCDVFSFPLTGALVATVNIPTRIFHLLRIKQAVRALQRHKPMIVVGITGSFGKTSTKEFLATILAQQVYVLKTVASKNSPIAIAEAVLNHLQRDHEVFIVEMGAYKEGEIRDMVSIVHPEVGIVTAINPQHQDLFGSIETTKRAKYELLAGLSGKRIAIVNADNQGTRQMGAWAKRDGCSVWWYTTEKTKDEDRKSENHTKTFIASDISLMLGSIEFTCMVGRDRARVKVPVLGRHQVGNVLAALAAAVACGMKLEDAARAASYIRPFSKTMEPVKGIHGSLFINDTFNNNPDAAKAAVQYLELSKGRKILIFQPMIELGAYASSSHRDVGAVAGRVCDDIFLTNDMHAKDFLSGARQGRGAATVHLVSAEKTVAWIKKNVQKGDTVLFKGKEAERVLKKLYV